MSRPMDDILADYLSGDPVRCTKGANDLLVALGRLPRRGIPADRWDDITQETAARIWHTRPKVEPGNAKSYVISVLKSVVSNQFAQHKRQSRLKEGLKEAREPVTPSAIEDTVHRGLENAAHFLETEVGFDAVDADQIANAERAWKYLFDELVPRVRDGHRAKSHGAAFEACVLEMRDLALEKITKKAIVDRELKMGEKRRTAENRVAKRYSRARERLLTAIGSSSDPGAPKPDFLKGVVVGLRERRQSDDAEVSASESNGL